MEVLYIYSWYKFFVIYLYWEYYLPSFCYDETWKLGALHAGCSVLIVWHGRRFQAYFFPSLYQSWNQPFSKDPWFLLMRNDFLKYLFISFGCTRSQLRLAGSLVAACGLLCCGMRTLSWGMWDLVPWPGVEPRPPALGVWSLTHCATRESPIFFFFGFDVWK